MGKLKNYEIFKNKGWTYNPQTGEIKDSRDKVSKSLDNRGYYKMVTSYNGKRIYCSAQRFAWYYIYGEIDDNLVIDHIDRDKINNKLNNLRLVTQQQNTFNTNAKGYYWNKKMNKWQVNLAMNGKNKYLGCFNTKEEARQAYLDAKQKYHII